MKSKLSNGILSAAIALAIAISSFLCGMNGIFAETVPTATQQPPDTHDISISSSPSRLSKAGDVTVSVTVTNTNTTSNSIGGNGDSGHAVGADSFGARPSNSPIPTNTPYPPVTGTPPVSDGTYYGVQIQNSYGVSFTSRDIPAGTAATFTATMHVTDAMIGTPLTFFVIWHERVNNNWENRSCQVQLTIGRANTAYLSLSRTMSKSGAAQDEQVQIIYTLVNTGSYTLNNIRLVDEKIAGLNPIVTPFSLAPGKSFSYTYSYTMGSESVVSKPVATFTPAGSSAVLSVSAPKQTLGLINAQLSKEVVVGTQDASGVTLTLYLTNNGNCLLSDLTVADDLGKTLASNFSLAIGEVKIIEYFVPNPETVRYVVFSITGKNQSVPFYDNTQSCIIRPYIDPSELGIDFSVEINSPLNSENIISLTFNIRNTGKTDYTDVSIEEKTLGILIDRFDVLRPSATPVSIPRDVNIDAPGKLVFTLTAHDTSGNEYTYDLALNANYDGDILPAGETPKPADPSVIEDPELGHKLDTLLTTTGKRLTTVYTVLGILVAIVLVVVIALAAIEISLRRKLKYSSADDNDAAIY